MFIAAGPPEGLHSRQEPLNELGSPGLAQAPLPQGLLVCSGFYSPAAQFQGASVVLINVLLGISALIIS